MCQVLILTKTNKIKNLQKATHVIAKALQDSQKDGFGYAVLGKHGVFGERTTKPSFQSRIRMPKGPELPDITVPTHNTFGELSNPKGPSIFHGRTSTNFKGLINTHPINLNGWSLIHNGVVTNRGEKYQKTTWNDSEDLVHYLSTVGIKGIEENLTGYYAVGAIDPNGNLHVIKDRIARLYVAYNLTLECLVFGTTEDLIKSIAKSLQWKLGNVELVKDDIYCVFNPKGELVKNESIESLGFGFSEAQYANQSLGYDLDEYMGEDIYNHSTRASGPSEDTPTVADLDLYKAELATMDASYSIRDWNGRPMDLEEFRDLDEITKRDCIVTRADGTVVDPNDYYTERLA